MVSNFSHFSHSLLSVTMASLKMRAKLNQNSNGLMGLPASGIIHKGRNQHLIAGSTNPYSIIHYAASGHMAPLPGVKNLPQCIRDMFEQRDHCTAMLSQRQRCSTMLLAGSSGGLQQYWCYQYSTILFW